MSIIVTDEGFAPDDWQQGFMPPQALGAEASTTAPAIGVDIAPDFDVSGLAPYLDLIDVIRVGFPAFTDGRGFSSAAQLRAMGFNGRLRAGGELLPDQYRKARRSGFDEVEISHERAKRQPEDQWRAQKPASEPSYQARLRQFV